MLTIKHRFGDKLRQLAADARQNVAENSQSTAGGSETEPKRVVRPKKIHEMDDKEIIERINKIKEDNENIRRENLLFSRYLLRITTSKMVETFDDYEDESNIIRETLKQAKELDAIRLWSFKKSSNHNKNGAPLWIKRFGNSRLHHDMPSILRLEEDRLYIAAYEVEQTRLEYKRMKAHADASVENLKLVYQHIKSDEDDQEKLNKELEARVQNFRISVGEKRFHSQSLEVPGELFVTRINRRIQSRINEIGVFRLNIRQLHARIEQVNEKIKYYDELTKISEVDLAFFLKEKGHNSEAFIELKHTCNMEKSFRSKAYNRLEELRKQLYQQKQHLHDAEKKAVGLQHYFERTMAQIDAAIHDTELILDENYRLKNSIEDVIKVPTITDYAYVIQQRKNLQHEIDIWTKRIHIAEALLSQLKQQSKPRLILPPLKPNINDKYLSTC